MVFTSVWDFVSFQHCSLCLGWNTIWLGFNQHTVIGSKGDIGHTLMREVHGQTSCFLNKLWGAKGPSDSVQGYRPGREVISVREMAWGNCWNLLCQHHRPGLNSCSFFLHVKETLKFLWQKIFSQSRPHRVKWQWLNECLPFFCLPHPKSISWEWGVSTWEFQLQGYGPPDSNPPSSMAAFKG